MWQSHLVGLVGVLAAATIGGGFVLAKADLRQPSPLLAAQTTPKAAPDGAKKEAERAASLAGRVWAVMSVVREHHLEPPALPDMTLAAATALLKAANAKAPDDLARRTAAVTTEAELAALFRELWPGGAAGEEKLEAAALDAFLDSIPGRAAVLREPQVRVNEQIRGNRYVGIGVQISANEKEQFPQIVIPFRRGAARAAGAKPGDLMVQIDGKDTKGVLNMDTITGWLRGEEGTSVTVVVRQPGSDATRTLKMVRAVIPFESVLGFQWAGEGWDYRLDRDAGIAYIWVQAIKSSTLHELRQVERRLRADGAKAVVLDLRFSAGDGHLHDATLLADGLLDGGLMWSVRGKDGKGAEYRADREALFRGWPVVALQNGTNDSCQGLLLAALQDNGRAALVGEPTGNDGLVRSLFPLPGGSNAVTVVTGRLERAVKDRGWPVRPDHALALDKAQTEAVRKWLTDKNLPEPPAGRPAADPQLDLAVTLLRRALKDGGKR